MKPLEPLIHDVQDFPRKGIVFKDFTPLLADPAGLALAVELMVNPYRVQDVDLVVGAESRGFIFGTAISRELSAGFIPVRKPGKLPRATHAVEYELEYGRDRLEIHADAIGPGDKVLLVDDLLATGGTLVACSELIRRAGGTIVGITVLIELTALQGRRRLAPHGEVHAVLQY
ncbi:MAG: adenine phosphoribosyltransferase [Phycisphaerae bacterium]|nr:adenine phosphoribosyltransferase [Phycisphaerae bacterium]